jgi:hypothetical protein
MTQDTSISCYTCNAQPAAQAGLAAGIICACTNPGSQYRAHQPGQRRPVPVIREETVTHTEMAGSRQKWSAYLEDPAGSFQGKAGILGDGNKRCFQYSGSGRQ